MYCCNFERRYWLEQDYCKSCAAFYQILQAMLLWCHVTEVVYVLGEDTGDSQRTTFGYSQTGPLENIIAQEHLDALNASPGGILQIPHEGLVVLLAHPSADQWFDYTDGRLHEFVWVLNCHQLAVGFLQRAGGVALLLTQIGMRAAWWHYLSPILNPWGFTISIQDFCLADNGMYHGMVSWSFSTVFRPTVAKQTSVNIALSLEFSLMKAMAALRTSRSLW